MNKEIEKIFFDFETFDENVEWNPVGKDEIKINIYASFPLSRLVVSLKLSIENWLNLVTFAKNTKDKTLIPQGRAAFGGFNVNKNEIIFASAPDIQHLKEISSKLLDGYKNHKKFEKIVKGRHQALEHEESEKRKYEQGEILGFYVSIMDENTEVMLGREDFKRFREECIAFEEKRRNPA